MNRKGSLLFETFVALMILSIGITSTLRVFGEALFVGTRNERTAAARQELNHLLFKWFAHPSGAQLPDAGTLTFPLEGDDPEMTCTVQSRNLWIPETASDSEKQTQAMKSNQYYYVRIAAMKNERTDLFDLEAVVSRSKPISP